MAIYGVLLTLVTADLAKGTGRFNFLQGAVQSSMGLGGVLSNSLFGFIAKSMGFNASFWGLSAVAMLGGVLYRLKCRRLSLAKNRTRNQNRSIAPA